MAGLKNKLVGKAREVKGRITNDENERLAGEVQQKNGKLEAKVTRLQGHYIGDQQTYRADAGTAAESDPLPQLEHGRRRLPSLLLLQSAPERARLWRRL